MGNHLEQLFWTVTAFYNWNNDEGIQRYSRYSIIKISHHHSFSPQERTIVSNCCKFVSNAHQSPCRGNPLTPNDTWKDPQEEKLYNVGVISKTWENNLVGKCNKKAMSIWASSSERSVSDRAVATLKLKCRRQWKRYWTKRL